MDVLTNSDARTSDTVSMAIKALRINGHWKTAAALVLDATDVVLNAKVYKAVISDCAKGKSAGLAFRIFAAMQAAGVKLDVFAYSSLINACGRVGKTEKALQVFKAMQAAGWPQRCFLPLADNPLRASERGTVDSHSRSYP